MMMERSWNRNSLLRRALIASLCLHALVALVLPTWERVQSTGPQPITTISFSKLLRIRIARPARAEAFIAKPAPSRERSPHVRLARVRAELSANRRIAARKPVPQNGAALAKRAASTIAAPAPSAAAKVALAVTASAQPAEPVKSPVPAATSADRSSANGSAAGGVMPFGADLKEPVLDPAVRTQLASRFAVHVTLLVTVGEDGRTKRVLFQPPLDAQIERQIETLLADANWDAAVCGGGITCEGQAVIKL